MKFTITHNVDFFEVVLTDAIEMNIFSSFLEALVTHEKWVSGSNILIDENTYDTSGITNADLQQIVQICTNQGVNLGAARCAIIVGREVDFGMNRMWETFVADNWTVITNIFRSRDKAISWLLDDR